MFVKAWEEIWPMNILSGMKAMIDGCPSFLYVTVLYNTYILQHFTLFYSPLHVIIQPRFIKTKRHQSCDYSVLHYELQTIITFYTFLISHFYAWDLMTLFIWAAWILEPVLCCSVIKVFVGHLKPQKSCTLSMASPLNQNGTQIYENGRISELGKEQWLHFSFTLFLHSIQS